MKSYSFRVAIEEDPFDDGRMAYHVWIPALKGCHTWGFTKAEALKSVQELLEACIEDLIKHNEPIPEEPKDEVTVLSGPVVTVNL